MEEGNKMGQIDSSIYFQSQGPDVVGNIQRGLALRDMMDERSLRNKELNENEAIKSAYSQGIKQGPDGKQYLDQNATLSAIAKVNPMKAYQQQRAFELDDVQKRKEDIEKKLQSIDLGSRILSGVKDQASFDKAIETGQKFGFDVSGLGKYYDPDLIKQYQSMSMTAKDNLAYQQNLMENAFKEKELGFKEKDLEARSLENKTKALKESSGMASELRKERSGLPTTRNTQEVAAAYNKIQSAAKYENDPAADMSLIFNYMKMLDPGSTVREGEYANAKNTTGIPDQVLNSYNQARTGTLLNPVQRKQFLNQSKDMYIAQMDVQNKVDSQFRDIAKKSGIAPEDVVLRFDANQPKPESVMQGGHEYFLNPKTGKYE